MTRLPPNAVSTNTIPGGSVLTSPISTAASHPGTARSAASAASAPLRRDEGHELALVGDVHRVDPEQLRGARDGRLHRDVALAHHHRHTRGACELVQHRGDAAAGGVAQAAHVRPSGREQRVDGRPQRARVGLDVGVEVELAPGEHDRGTVLADRAGDDDPVAGAQACRREHGARVDLSDPGRAQVHRVGVAALDDLRVAGNDLDAGRGGGRGDRLDLGPQVVGREPLLEHHRNGERKRPGAGHRQVVHRAVHGQLSDGAAGKADRLDDEAVGRERELHPRDRHGAGVGKRPQRGRPVGRHEQALDQRLSCLAAGAVGHRDPGVAELRRLRADGLDDVQHPLLAIGRIGGARHPHTTSRSRAKRP